MIELLVVVGIIAVLIALLLPALAKARKHALELKCASNLHSIGQALTMYTQTYGYYPGAAVIRQLSADTWALWPVRLRQFTAGDQEVFYCPAADERCRWRKEDPIAPSGRADTFHAGYGYEVGEPLLDWNTRFFSYGYNALGTYGNAPIAIQRGLGFIIISPNANIEAWRRESFRELRASRVRVASEMIAIADSVADGAWDFQIVPQIIDVSNPQRKPRWVGALHRGGANVLFCDGHVQWYLQQDLVCDSSLPGTSQWFRESLWNSDHISHEE